MKRGLHSREKKTLSANGLLKKIRNVFKKVKTTQTSIRGKTKQISLADSLMSALAMFSLKMPSLLAFDRAKREKTISHNLKKLYGIVYAPSDTHMREELDKIDPYCLREGFLTVFEAAQRGKVIERYKFLNTYLLSIDGTGLFNSDSINCDNCCKKQHRDGSITYYHQALGASIVHPECSQVIPLCPELISKQDGVSKNDCERRALQRFLRKLKKEHPRLKLTILYDALAANTPTINEIKSYGHDFIISAKPGNNKVLFEWINGSDLEEISIKVGKNKYNFRYVNGIPLNDAKDAPLVNFLECTALEIKGKKEKKKLFTWITSHTITPDNVFLIMQGGRSRWKIENETFNTLKNQGYQLEHNFGHGNKHLLEVFALLMMLAFLIDQIQEAACGLFKAALQKASSRRYLWNKMRGYFQICFVDSWEELFMAIDQEIGVILSINTS